MASNKALAGPKKPCPMCMNRVVGDRWTKSILSGEKTSVEAASKLRMAIEEVDEHVYKHTQTLTKIETPTRLATTTRDKEYFLDQLEQMNWTLQTALDSIQTSDEYSTRNLTTLTKEIRETLKLLAEVAGVIGADNSASMQKNLVEMQQKYLVLTGLILEVACPVCQQKIVERLKGEIDAEKKDA